MGLGKKTRFQSKQHRREIKQQKYKTELIRTICLIFLIGLTASLVIVKIMTLLYPIASQYIKEIIQSYRNGNVTVTNPFLKNSLKYEEFKSLYYQKEPVLFPSSHSDTHNHVEIMWNYIEDVCIEGRNGVSDTVGSGSASNSASASNSNSNSGTVLSDQCTLNRPFVLNFSSSFASTRHLFSVPKIPSNTNKNESRLISNYRNNITFELKFPCEDVESSCPTFRQQTQSWNELLSGRKKWFLYRPGGLISSLLLCLF